MIAVPLVSRLSYGEIFTVPYFVMSLKGNFVALSVRSHVSMYSNEHTPHGQLYSCILIATSFIYMQMTS